MDTKLSETDFTEDLKKIDVPTLVMHGEDDQLVPIKVTGLNSARPIRGAKDIYDQGTPHGLIRIGPHSRRLKFSKNS